MTGKDHWEILARARAIRDPDLVPRGRPDRPARGRQEVVLGPFHGHRTWGHITAQASDGVGFTTGRLEFGYTEKVRANVPVANHHVLA